MIDEVISLVNVSSVFQLVEAKNFHMCPFNLDFFHLFTQKKLVELTW
jgi:hypothetical protein